MSSHDTVDFDPTRAVELDPSATTEIAPMSAANAEQYAADIIATVQESHRTVPAHEAEAVAALTEAIQEELGGGPRFANDVEFQTAKISLEQDVYGNSGPEVVVEGQQIVSDAEFEAAKNQLNEEVYGQTSEVVVEAALSVSTPEIAAVPTATKTINTADAAIRSVLPRAVGVWADKAQDAIEKGFSSLRGKLGGLFARGDKSQPVTSSDARVRTEVVANVTQEAKVEFKEEGVLGALNSAYANMSGEARARFDAARKEREVVLSTKSPEMIALEAEIKEIEDRIVSRKAATYQRVEYGVQGAHYDQKAGTARRTDGFIDNAIANRSNAEYGEQEQLTSLRGRLMSARLKQGRINSDRVQALAKK